MYDTNRHASMEGRMFRRPQHYTRNYRQLRNADSERNGLSQGREHQLVVQYQVVSLKIHIEVTLHRLNRGYLHI